MRSPKVGKFTLESLTTGMYSHPEIVYREYIQNSADAIDQAVEKGIIPIADAYIEIKLDLEDRTITIADNGIGIEADLAESTLLDIGASRKHHSKRRGFRGIGRLGGISYCEELVFTTSYPGEAIATEITWNCKALKALVRPDGDSDEQLVDVISGVTTSNTRKEKKAAHYFIVQMKGVDEEVLLNESYIRDYLSQVAPIPYDATNFPQAMEIHRHLSMLGKPLEEYTVLFNGDPNPLTKPYTSWFKFKDQIEQIKNIEFHEERDSKGNLIFCGWNAQTNWLGQLANESKSIRGMRLKKRNIQIGDETVLDDFFSQTRFNKWTIGEIFVFSDVIPNGRRDFFERDKEFTQLEKGLYHYLRDYLSGFPPEFSEQRSKNKEIRNLTNDIDSRTNALSQKLESGEISRSKALKELEDIRKTAKKVEAKTGKKIPKNEPASKQEPSKGQNLVINPKPQNNSAEKQPPSPITSKGQPKSSPGGETQPGEEKVKTILNILVELENKAIDLSSVRIDNLSTQYGKEVRKVVSKIFNIIEETCKCDNPDYLIERIVDQLNKTIIK